MIIPKVWLWTVYVTWDDGENEDIEVEAATVRQAMRIASGVLDDGYEPGWTIRSARRVLGVSVASL